MALPKDAEDMPEAVQNAVGAIKEQGIGGPFALVAGTETYQMIMAGDRRGLPLRRRVEDLLGGGRLLWSPAVEDAVLLSIRGGDFQLTVGQDLAVGYHGQDGQNVNLYLTESFTFQVLEPNAAVTLKRS